MASYLMLEEFRSRTLMPSADVDALETIAPGWIDIQLEDESRNIDSQLTKRYAIPFGTPVPRAVLRWLTKIVTLSAFARRGFDSNDAQATLYKEQHDAALAEIQKAADSETGLYELPLRDDLSASGVSKGGPYAYSEQSPYVWTDRQRAVATDEDASGSGTGG